MAMRGIRVFKWGEDPYTCGRGGKGRVDGRGEVIVKAQSGVADGWVGRFMAGQTWQTCKWTSGVRADIFLQHSNPIPCTVRVRRFWECAGGSEKCHEFKEGAGSKGCEQFVL